MIWFENMDDLQGIAEDPELWQLLYGYMAVCKFEFLETEDEADLVEHDFAFALATVEDLEQLQANGTPEELVDISINDGFSVRRIVRLVFPTAVIFYQTEPGDDPAQLFLRREKLRK